MSLPLDDPRVAQLLTDMVDRRIRGALDSQARIRYGTVAAVDTAAGTASLLLGGSATPSPGFVYAGVAPSAGDRVRAVNRGADRYIEADLDASSNPALRWVPLIPIYSVANAATTTSTSEVSTTSPEITVLPTTGVKAIVGHVLGQVSTTVVSSYIYVQNWGGGGVSGIVYATTGILTSCLFLISPGGTNGRQMQYTIRASSGVAATLTYYVRVTGYWTEL